jgi:serine/threonine-protein kinase
MLGPGTRLGPYEIQSALGAGGMGEVYRAKDTKLGRDVAIKVLPSSLTSDPERLARFGREAQVLASLNHPNIAAIHHLETTGDAPALVMELVEGESLADRIARGPVPIDEALPIAKQIAEALEAAHEQGVIHRDLKPANIKVRPDGTVKVLDFGLAKLADSNPSSNLSSAGLSMSPTITSPTLVSGVGVLLGTAAYMSPEQAKGKPADKRSDIWAFGCVLYEMLVGRAVFVGDDVADTLANVLKAQPDWSLIPQDVSPSVHLLLRRALEKDRSRRLAHLAAAVFALEEAESSPHLATKDPRRISKPARLAIAAIAVVSLVVAGTAVLLQRSNAPQSAPIRVTLRVGPNNSVLAGSGQPVLAVSGDGRRIAYATGEGLYVQELSRFEPTLIYRAEARQTIASPAFSPDGQFIAFYSVLDQSIHRIEVSGGADVRVCRTSFPYGIAWDRVGIVFGQGEAGIGRCTVAGGQPEQLIRVSAAELADEPQILPDNDHILFTIASREAGVVAPWDTAQVVVQSLKTGERKAVIQGGSGARYVNGRLFYALGAVIFAVPFDVNRLATTGDAVAVVEGVRRAGVTGVAHYAISSSGTLYYIPGPDTSLVANKLVAIADATGTATRLPLPARPYSQIRASPDGSRLALLTEDAKEATIWTYSVGSGAALQRLTIGGRNRFPVWSGDGQQIAFQSNRDGTPAVFVQRVDGTVPAARLTDPASGEEHIPESWSPDGRQILVSTLRTGMYELGVLSVGQRTLQSLHVRSVQPIGAVFSPDGRWIAYATSTATGPAAVPDRGIYVQPFPPTGAIYQAPTVGLDFHPAWSARGERLFYVPSNISGKMTSVSVTVTGPHAVTFGQPVTVPATVTGNRTSGSPRAWDVLRDGRFVGLADAEEPAAANANEIRAVINWFTELQQRVPTR